MVDLFLQPGKENFRGRYWYGGETGGVEKIGTPSAAYLASFPTVLHPSGL